MIRFFAVLDPADRETARNVFLVDDGDDPVAMVVFDHAERRWVAESALIEYVAGPRASDCTEITRDDATRLLAEWDATLPDGSEIAALARAER